MKVTSLKDVETYLYTSVVLPLKNRDGLSLTCPSPIFGKNGNPWNMEVIQPQVPRGRHNYERDFNQVIEPFLVYLHGATDKPQILAQYNPKTKAVEIYEHPFKLLNAMPLLGKLHQMFNSHAPFGRVSIRKRRPVQRVQNRPSNAPHIDWEEDEEGYDDEDI